jgi:hypothetical protein
LKPNPGHFRRFRPAALSCVLVVGLLLVTCAAAHATSPLRIAVGVERAQDLALAEPPAEHTAMRALAQGVREACAEPAAHRLRSVTAACKTLGDAPESNVCVDETTEQALTRQIECSSGEVTANAIDLSRSGCETADCYEVEARKAGASHLLVVTATWIDSGLTITGRFTDLRDGSVRPFAPTDFAPRYSAVWPRTEPQVLGLLKWLARARVGAAMLEAYDAEGATGEGGALAPAAPPAASTPALMVPGPPIEAASPDRRWIGWTLIGAGVAAGLGSAIAWDKNDEPTDCGTTSCRKELHTLIPAVGLGVAAVGALVTGIVALIRERHDRGGLTLFLHPTGVALGGSFR